jgi:hypothetical protein
MRYRKDVTIGPVAQHGIESIDDGDDACAERNLFTAKAPRIAAAIEEFLVCQNDFRGVAQERDAREDIISDLAMGAPGALLIVPSPLYS